MKILIVVDMQHDFIDGSLANTAAQKIIPNIVKKIQDFDGDLIVFTRDTHSDNYLETAEGKVLPVKHCIKDSTGWFVVTELLSAADDSEKPRIFLDKPTFGYKDWVTFFTKHDIDPTEIEIVGTCTDICVASNALILKAEYPNATFTVDASCCAGLSPEKHAAALEVLGSCQVNVVNN